MLVIGCGKAGLTTIATVQKYFKGARIYAIDVSDRNIEAATRMLKGTEGVVSKYALLALGTNLKESMLKTLAMFLIL